ncbi:hypothetical protein SAY87_027618 [Trapa incisa]|uniref:Anaphase-promoting complex subunit 1 N-terminal domain-containing protein n=1 Tax=Trapa incisa TaxID=236973 RepID=A0AAN7PKG8_9MYRT|nr:hypothetical protein SAY87_027618 [Trapa incisa]
MKKIVSMWKFRIFFEQLKNRACWARFSEASKALICILHIDCLTIYNTSGEVVEIPLCCSITSIWSLLHGLLLQQGAEGDFPSSVPNISTNLMFGATDTFRSRREIGQSPMCNNLMGGFDNTTKGDAALLLSHIILKDPMEDPELIYIEERGKVNIMKDFDERTIWTSDQVHPMASYNQSEGKLGPEAASKIPVPFIDPSFLKNCSSRKIDELCEGKFSRTMHDMEVS